jgi:CoA:oxalate CoA-transferase
VGALSGIKVLELSHYIAGPQCAMILADHGAEVTKVEPLEGERGRFAPPFSPEGDSLYFACHNRGKRSVTLDLRQAEARPVLDRLIAETDVVVTNHVPGVPERLGYGYERVAALNPRAIFVHITGYGREGPLSRYVAFDGAVQAMSGFSSMTGEKDGPALLSQVLVADHTTGAHAAIAALCAVVERAATGEGRLVEVNMLNAMVSMLAHFIPAHALLGEEPTRVGSKSATRFVNILPAADGGVYVAPITPAMWKSFCDILERPDWGAMPPRVAYGDAARRSEIELAAEAWLGRRTAAQAADDLQAVGIVSGAVRSIAQLYRDEQAHPTGAIGKVVLPRGGEPVPVPAPSFHHPADDAAIPKVPALGADTEAVLRRLGFDAGDLDRLARAQVIGSLNPNGVDA